MSEEVVKEGWAKPISSQKYHYFRDGRSLCGKYGLFFGMQTPLEHDTGLHADDCKECRRRLLREEKQEDGKQ